MKRFFCSFNTILVLFVVILLSGCTGSGSFEEVEYDDEQMKKVAYDSLPAEEQKTIIRSFDDYLSKVEGEDDTVSFVYNEDALNIENVWIYASLEEVVLSSLDGIAWVNDEVEEDIGSQKNRNGIALRIEMSTTNLMLGPLVVYVDPIKKEVIGYGIRF